MIILSRIGIINQTIRQAENLKIEFLILNFMKNISLFLLKKKGIPILKRYGVRRAAVFGSFARNQMRKSSDIDILVDIRKNISLLDFVGLKLEIEEALGKKVDIVEYNTIKPAIKEKVIREQLVIL